MSENGTLLAGVWCSDSDVVHEWIGNLVVRLLELEEQNEHQAAAYAKMHGVPAGSVTAEASVVLTLEIETSDGKEIEVPVRLKIDRPTDNTEVIAKHVIEGI